MRVVSDVQSDVPAPAPPDTEALACGMIPAVTIAAGLFLLVSCIWAARVGQSAVAGIFGTFSAFWLSFGFLLFGIVNGSFGFSTDPTVLAGQVQNMQATYVLSWLIVLSAIFAYIWYGAMTAELGGRPLPLGNPLQS